MSQSILFSLSRSLFVDSSLFKFLETNINLCFSLAKPFAVSNPIISNIDYTIEYLKNLKPEAQRFLITSKDRAKGKELNKNANVIYDIQEFIKLIA